MPDMTEISMPAVVVGYVNSGNVCHPSCFMDNRSIVEVFTDYNESPRLVSHLYCPGKRDIVVIVLFAFHACYEIVGGRYFNIAVFL